MQNKYLLSFFISILFFVGSSCAFVGMDTEIDSAESSSEKIKLIDDFLAKLNQNGFSGSVLVSDGKEVFNKCYGFADRKNNIRCNENTVFDIGSVTKQFTGAAILKLEMQGKLSVNDRIDKYFKNVPDDKKAITIHQLLTHSGGFPPAIGDDYEKLERDAFLTRAFKIKLNFKPGSKYDYSNVGYSVLAAIIEKASGKSYEQFLHDNLFMPAKMFTTGYKLPKWKQEQIAVGYRGEKRWGKPTEKAWGKTSPYWNLLGNGGILSTTADLYKWHQALLTDDILNKTAKGKYYKRHIEEGESAGTYYGYGWALFPTLRKTTLITHNGGNGIFFCDFLRYTEEKITIILLSNSMSREFERIPREIAKTLLVGDYKPAIKMRSGKKQIISLDKHPNGKLIKTLLRTISSQNKEEITKFINANFLPNLLSVAPIEKHLEILSKLGAEVKGLEIDKVTVEDTDTIISFKGKEDDLKIVIENGKIAGILF